MYVIVADINYTTYTQVNIFKGRPLCSPRKQRKGITMASHLFTSMMCKREVYKRAHYNLGEREKQICRYDAILNRILHMRRLYEYCPHFLLG